jgi:nucleoside-diphosphate-sugar epimerase
MSRPLRVLSFSGVSYTSFQGGGVKGNRALFADLAARGHDVRVFLPCFEADPGMVPRQQTLADLVAAGIDVRRRDEGVVDFCIDGVQLTGFLIRTDAAGQIDWSGLHRFVPAGLEFEPDAVVVSNAMTLQRLLLELAAAIDPARAVVLVHTALELMHAFGPTTTDPDTRLTELLRSAASVAVVSEYLRDYLRQWGAVDSTVMRFPFFGPGPWPELGRFDEGLVTMVNPGPSKGFEVFRQLVETMPDVAFGAVPSWDTAPEILARLRAFPNVEILPFSPDVDDVFRRTRVLVAPSLCPESFGIVAVEAMLRGIPVLAADHAGLREAKLGVEYLLPVRPIVYEQVGHRFVSHIPTQDAGPWERCLRELLSDRALYEDVSRRSRAAALRHASQPGGAAQLEELLEPLRRKRASSEVGGA